MDLFSQLFSGLVLHINKCTVVSTYQVKSAVDPFQDKFVRRTPLKHEVLAPPISQQTKGMLTTYTMPHTESVSQYQLS